ncbi:MAG TPA: hypothetical protein VGH89_27845 [Pseudonocardia sp.]|jgi:hypothetical protein
MGFSAGAGPQIPGQLGTREICRQVIAEGAKQVVVVTEDPRRVRRLGDLPRGVRIEHCKRLLRVETELARVAGVTVLVYDQVCAAELRRLRKRDKAPDPAKRVYINTDVCGPPGRCRSPARGGRPPAGSVRRPVDHFFGIDGLIADGGVNVAVSGDELARCAAAFHA